MGQGDSTPAQDAPEDDAPSFAAEEVDLVADTLEGADVPDAIDASSSGLDSSGAGSAPPGTTTQVRELLRQVSASGKRKHFEQQLGYLRVIIERTRAEMWARQRVSVGAFPLELNGAIRDSLGSSRKDVQLKAAELVLMLAPHASNMVFGFTESHSAHLRRVQRQRELLADETLLAESGLSRDALRISNTDQVFLASTEHFESMSVELNEHTMNMLSYMLLDGNPEVVQVGALLLCVLYLHPQNRITAHEPRGLTVLVSDERPLTQYLGTTALGNLCLASHPKLGESSTIAFSVDQVMHTGLIELMSVLCDPGSPLVVLEAALRALLLFAGTDKQRAHIAHVRVCYAALLQAGPTRGPGTVSTVERTGDASAFDAATWGKCCPALHMLFACLRLETSGSHGGAFRHLEEAVRCSDLAYELACLLVSELAACEDCDWLFAKPIVGLGSAEASPRGKPHRARSGPERADWRPPPGVRMWCDVLFRNFCEAKGSFSSKVALGMCILALGRSRAAMDRFQESYALSRVVEPFIMLFGQNAAYSAHACWSSFTSSGAYLSTGSVLPSIALLKELLPDSELAAFFRKLPFDAQRPQLDPGMEEHWTLFFQRGLCDVLEHIVGQCAGQQSVPGQWTVLDVPHELLSLVAAALEKCRDVGVCRRLLRITTVLALQNEGTAEKLAELGVARLLVQILWLLVEDLGLLVVEVVEHEDGLSAPLFPSEDTSSMHSGAAGLLGTNGEKGGNGGGLSSTDEQFRRRMLSSKICIATSLVLRMRKLLGQAEHALFPLVLCAINAFAVHNSMRSLLGIQYRLRGFLFKLVQLFRTETSIGGSTARADGKAAGGPSKGASVCIPIVFPERLQVAEVHKELVLSLGNLAPQNASMGKLAWFKEDNLVTLRGLVGMASLGLELDGAAEGAKAWDLSQRFQRFKALTALYNVSKSRGVVLILLSHTSLLSALGALLGKGDRGSWVAVEERCMALAVLRNLTMAPEGMRLWLKLENPARMCIDSAGLFMPVHSHALRQHARTGLSMGLGKGMVHLGSSARLGRPESADSGQLAAYRSLFHDGDHPSKLGLLDAGPLAYFEEPRRKVAQRAAAVRRRLGTSGWGVVFSAEDFVVLHADGVPLESEWTLCVWVLVNFEDNARAQDVYTLVQGTNGDCPIAVVRRSLARPGSRAGSAVDYVYELGTFSAEQGAWFGSGIDLFKLVPGWHHLVAVGVGGKTLFYLDAEKDVPLASVDFQSRSNIFVLGNAVHGDEPWSTAAADFRYYPFALPRDTTDWDLYFDGRTWGLAALPAASAFPTTCCSPGSEADDPDAQWRSAGDLPWHLRPPDFGRHLVASFADGALLHLLLTEFARSDGSREQELATLILGDLCLCESLRNKVLASDAHGALFKLLSAPADTADERRAALSTPSAARLGPAATEAALNASLFHAERARWLERARCRLLYLTI